MRTINSKAELNKMKKDEFEAFIKELFADKTNVEKEDFKLFLSTPIATTDKCGKAKTRMPGYYDIQSYIVKRYFPHLVPTKEKTVRENLLNWF